MTNPKEGYDSGIKRCVVGSVDASGNFTADNPGGAFNANDTSARIYSACNLGEPTGSATTTGTIFFYMSAFVLPSPGVVNSILWNGSGNAGNSGATEELEWAVLQSADGKVSNIIASGTHDVVNTKNGSEVETGINASVPSQFYVGVIGIAGGQWNIETAGRISYPGIPASTGSLTYGYPSVTKVTFDAPSVGDTVGWGGIALVQNISWTPS